MKFFTATLAVLAVAMTSNAATAEDREEAADLAAGLTITSRPKIAEAFKQLARGARWTQTSSTHLDFQSEHPQGLAITRDRFFLSSVEIIEPTVRYPAPVDGYDRTPGKGKGHVFVLDKSGKLLKDIVLEDGDKYHPGGIDFDGTYIWVPVAEYRPNSAADVYRIHARTLKVEKMFEADNHYGGVVHDKSANRLVGNTWGSRNFTAWDFDGKVLERWNNPSFFVDYQDCQYISSGKAICSGVANIPQNPAGYAALIQNGVNASTIYYELGGLALIDLKTHAVEHEIPITVWSKLGHSITRNPVKLRMTAGKLTLWAAPDDGTEVGGTDLLSFTI